MNDVLTLRFLNYMKKVQTRIQIHLQIRNKNLSMCVSVSMYVSSQNSFTHICFGYVVVCLIVHKKSRNL
jgi:hypothetical protein